MEFRAIKSVASAPFDASHVGQDLAELEGLLWCDACYTCARMCVYECLLCIQRPFSKRQNKWQPKQIQREMMKDQKKKEKEKGKKQPLVSRAVLKHELMDWTVITGAL